MICKKWAKSLLKLNAIIYCFFLLPYVDIQSFVANFLILRIHVGDEVIFNV